MKKVFAMAITAALLAYTADVFPAITVTSIQGKAAFKDRGAWKQLSPRQTLREGMKVSTGVNSTAVLDIDGTAVTIRPMSMVGVTRNLVKDGASNTNLGLKYGSVNAKVPKIQGIRTNFRISTPIATSSVRGTEEEVSYGPKGGMHVKVLAGLVKVENPSGVASTVGKWQSFQITKGNARPQFLLSNLRTGSMVNIMPDNISDTEKEFFEMFGEELRDNPSDEGLILEQFPSATINVRIVFP